MVGVWQSRYCAASNFASVLGLTFLYRTETPTPGETACNHHCVTAHFILRLLDRLGARIKWSFSTIEVNIDQFDMELCDPGRPSRESSSVELQVELEVERQTKINMDRSRRLYQVEVVGPA